MGMARSVRDRGQRRDDHIARNPRPWPCTGRAGLRRWGAAAARPAPVQEVAMRNEFDVGSVRRRFALAVVTALALLGGAFAVLEAAF